MRTWSLALFVLFAALSQSCGESGSTEQPAVLGGSGGSLPEAEPEAAAGAGGTTPVGNPDCQFNVQKQSCSDCLHTTCGDTCAACSKLPSCGTLYVCMNKCSTYQCQKDCEAKAPEALVPLMDFLGRGGCVDTQCKTECNLGLGSGTDPYENYRAKCLEKINELRAKAGAAALVRDYNGEDCADVQARNDAESGTPGGKSPNCAESAQTECPAAPGSPDFLVQDCLQKFFDEGPSSEHYAHIVNASHTRVACGFYLASDGNFWMLQNFDED